MTSSASENDVLIRLAGVSKTYGHAEAVVEFPLWLLALVLAFSALITTLATILPAWSVSRVDPIIALRHD